MTLTTHEQYLHAFAEVTDDLVWIREAAAVNFLYVSPSYERLTGKSVTDVYNDPFALLDAAVIEDHSLLRTAIADSGTEKTTYRFRFIDRQGLVLWFKARLHTDYDKSGQPLYRVGILSDITEDVEQELLLQQALANEREINRITSNFVSIVSHEFRTPLSTIFSGAEIIEILSERVKNKPLSAKLSHFARQTCQQIIRLNDLISAVSIQEKMLSGQLALMPQAFELVDFCQQLAARAQETVSSKQSIAFTSTIDQRIVHFDYALLERCLLNLFTNALNYSEGSAKMVEFILAETPTGVQFSVKDYGIGIPAAEIDQLGRIFFRGSNTQGVSGSGLGLAFVKSFVALQGGHLAIESVRHQYTRCTLDFPMSPAA